MNKIISKYFQLIRKKIPNFELSECKNDLERAMDACLHTLYPWPT